MSVSNAADMDVISRLVIRNDYSLKLTMGS